MAGAAPSPAGNWSRNSRRGAEEEEIRAAADWLEDLGAIDDAAYARLVARHYGDRGYGPAGSGRNCAAAGCPGPLG